MIKPTTIIKVNRMHRKLKREKISEMVQHQQVKADTAHAKLSEFLGYTSTHGLSHLKRVESPLGQTLWIIITVFAACMVISQVVILIETFYKYDYEVSVMMKYEKSLEFPAVTICNVNPVR